MAMLLASLVLTQRTYVDRDLVYAHVEGRDLKLDAYKPKMPIGKVFIAFHGGPVDGGGKGRQTGELCAYLTARGFTCFDVDYRYPKGVGAKLDKDIYTSTDDAVSAYSWVQKHAKEYGGDPNKVGIGGISGGAVTALLTAYERKPGVQAVIDIGGAMYGHENTVRKTGPAILIVHASEDRQIPYHYAEALANQANRVGLRHRFVTIPGPGPLNLRAEIKGYSILEHVESFLREAI